MYNKNKKILLPPPFNGINMLAKYLICIFLALVSIYFLSNLIRKHTNIDGEYWSSFVQSRRRMLRIAQIAPLVESVPPKKYGGTERIVYYLVEELARRGHQMTLFASNDSETSAKLVANWPHLKENPTDRGPLYNWMMAQIRENASEFDILHFHTDVHYNEVHDILVENKSTVVMTMHGLFGWSPELGGVYNHIPLISISNDQRTHTNSKPNFIATVYHGLPKNLYKFVEHPNAQKPYLAFLGRIDPTKLPDWAIKIAIKSNIRLKIAARADPNDYWLKEIKPMIEEHKDLVEFVGELNDGQKNEFLGNALAFIFPINWPEPFGMVMIESMACGTPVIARRSGSVPEIVEEGVSGFLFDTIDQAVEAVKNASKIERTGVRRAFERRFTVEKMVDGYEEIYYKRLGEERKP